MSEPRIAVEHNPRAMRSELFLTIPDEYLVGTRWPRLRIWWWMNKLVFQVFTMPKERATGVRDSNKPTPRRPTGG